MVGPVRKRQAVRHVIGQFDVSERRACRGLTTHRSTHRYRGRRPIKDHALLAEIKRLSAQHPRYGYRTICSKLRLKGWKVNVKRVHRLWCQEGLKVPVKAHKRRRLGTPEQGASRKRASRMNEVWSYDFIYDQTESGRVLKWMPVVDEHSKENLALEVGPSLNSTDVVRVLETLVAQRGAPEYIRSDNGPEFIAKKVRRWIEERGFKTLYIEPGSPWENPFIESFNSRFRDEFLNVESFGSVLEAKVLGKEFRRNYNEERPHSSLGGIPPAEFAVRCQATFGATPLTPPDNAGNVPNHQQVSH